MARSTAPEADHQHEAGAGLLHRGGYDEGLVGGAQAWYGEKRRGHDQRHQQRLWQQPKALEGLFEGAGHGFHFAFVFSVSRASVLVHGAAKKFRTDEAGARSGGLILTPWPAGVGDEDGENHPEERHKQADDREAACEHSGLPQCRGECPHASEPALR